MARAGSSPPVEALPSAVEAGLAANRARVLAQIERDADGALELARWMYHHPENSLVEHRTSARYVEALEERGFSIERSAADLETAFVATWGRSDATVTVALLAEMDALPEIGHACGHNLSGPASLLAAFGLASVLAPSALRLRVVGCPAEELGIGKRRLVAAGVFDGVDAAMMAHASDMRRAHRLFLGNRKLDLVFRGRAAHAAAYPEQGLNALDGVIQLFVGLGLLRQQLPRGVRVHGIVTDGGQAPNIIPERAAAQIWIRALDADELTDAVRRVRNCAEGAATAVGANLDVTELESTSPPMRPNLALADCYRRQLVRMGLDETDHAPGDNIGSSDITHVSEVVPTIHPNFPIGRDLKLHTRAFAEATEGPLAAEGLLEAARALAGTILELVHDPATRAAVARDPAG